MNEISETSVTNLMELMLDEDWVRQAVRFEDEADCSMEAGLKSPRTGSCCNDSRLKKNLGQDGTAQASHCGDEFDVGGKS